MLSRPILIQLSVTLDELKKLSFERQMDIILDAFESSWRKGLKPAVTEYANLVEPEFQKRLLRELILIERECFNEIGDPTAPKDKSSSGTVDSSQLETLDANLGNRNEPSSDIPTHFDRFAIKKLLGRGSHGVVYEAEDVEIRRRVAIKIAYSSSGSDSSRAFATEAANASQVDHRGVVKILEVGDYRGTNFMVSELILGPSLSEFASSQKLDDVACMRILADIAQVVGAAHRCGVIHRDLKPTNIMMEVVDSGSSRNVDESETKDPFLLEAHRVRILDFGIAKMLERSTRRTVQGDIVGTPHYMSPEQASGNSLNVNERSDIFSLGVILYELLCGKLPFDGSEMAVVSGIRDLKAPPIRSVRSDIPAALEVIVHKCLERNPADRYKSAAELEQDIRKWLAGQKPLALRRREAKRLAIASTAIVAVCLLIGALFFAERSGWFQSTASRARLEAWLTNEQPQSLLEWIANGKPETMQKDLDVLRARDWKEQDLWRLRFASIFANPDAKVDDPKLIANDFVDRLQERYWFEISKAVPNALIAEFEAMALVEQEAIKRQILFGMVAERWGRIADTRGLKLLLNEAKTEDLKLVVQATIKLANQNFEFMQWLSNEFDRTELKDTEGLPSDEANRWRAKLGLIAVGLRDWDRVDKLLSASIDPGARNYFIYWFDRCDFSISALMERFANYEDDWKSTAALACLSSIPIQKLSDQQRSDFEQMLMDAYDSHRSAGVHRSTRKLLIAWGLGDFVSEVDSSAQLRSDRNWYTTPFGMRMSIVRAPQQFWFGPTSDTRGLPRMLVNLTYSFAVAEELVSEIQYSEFDPSKFPIPKDTPAFGVNWSEAVRFCDWLNRREGIEDRDSIEFLEDMPHRFTESADGYRLLSVGEWECFFRGGTKTRISLGDAVAKYMEDMPGIDRSLQRNFGPVQSDTLKLNFLEWTSTGLQAYGNGKVLSNTETTIISKDEWVAYRGSSNADNEKAYPQDIVGWTERESAQSGTHGFRLARRIQ